MTARPANTVVITEEEIRLVEEAAECLMRSYRRHGVSDARQPTEWREGKTLEQLAAKLAAFRAG